jgi:hypothetical protein
MINKLALDGLKQRFPIGTKVELVCMNDTQAPMIGTKGIVKYIDDVGTIHVEWENGSTLGVAYGEDKCRKI